MSTVTCDPDKYIKFANSLHKDLQLSLAKNMEENLAFTDINVNVSRENKITSQWYQKPPDTGIMFNLLQNIKRKIH